MKVGTQVRDVADEFHDKAFKTRDQKAIGWLFTSFAVYLRDILSSTNPEPDALELAKVTPREFVLQFRAAFDLDEPTFLACVSSTKDFLDRGFEDWPAYLDTFLDGKYPHFALNYWLRQQCRLRRQTPATFWGLLIPLEEGGPLDNLALLASPSPQTLDPVREQAFATGDIEYVGAMYTILKYLLRDEYSKGALQWTTEDDFNEQFLLRVVAGVQPERRTERRASSAAARVRAAESLLARTPRTSLSLSRIHSNELRYAPPPPPSSPLMYLPTL